MSQGPVPIAPTTTCSSGGDETGECFGQGRRAVGRGADRQNTPSQLETKERPAKGPIAQSWLTPQCTSRTYTCTLHTHTHTLLQSSFIYHLPCFFSYFLLHPKSLSCLSLCFATFVISPYFHFLFHFSHLLLCIMLCLLCTFPLSRHPFCAWMYICCGKDGTNLKARPIPKSPSHAARHNSAPMPSTSSAFYVKIIRFPPAELLWKHKVMNQ